MSVGINKVILIGHVGKIESHDAVVRVSLATGEKYKDKNGNVHEHTEWHNIAMFGKLAEIANRYVEKGSQLYIEGKLRTNKYTDKNGAEQSNKQIIAETMKLLGQKSGERQQSKPAPQQYQSKPQQNSAPNYPELDDMEIPF